MKTLILFIIFLFLIVTAAVGLVLWDEGNNRAERYVKRLEKYAEKNQALRDELTAKEVEVINLKTELKHQKELLNYALTHPQDYIK